MTEEYEMICPDCGHVRIEPHITYCLCQLHTWYSKDIDKALEDVKEKFGTREKMRKYLKSHKPL